MRAERRHARHLLCLVVAVVAGAACDVQYPTEPTGQPLLGLELQYDRPSRVLSVNQSVGVIVYALDSDGVHRLVTSDTVLTSSDGGVARVEPRANGASVTLPRSIRGVAPGRADIVASYQGQTASLPVFVQGFLPPVYPSLTVGVSLTSSSAPTVGSALQATATYVDSTLRSQNVTTAAGTTWQSSNPAIASVEGGRLTLLQVGTVEITTTHAGLSDSIRVSVAPR